MILLFAGGLVAGACGGFFVLGMVSAWYADCKDRRNRPEEDRWKEEDQWP